MMDLAVFDNAVSTPFELLRKVGESFPNGVYKKEIEAERARRIKFSQTQKSEVGKLNDKLLSEGKSFAERKEIVHGRLEAIENYSKALRQSREIIPIHEMFSNRGDFNELVRHGLRRFIRVNFDYLFYV